MAGNWITIHREFMEWEWYTDVKTKSLFLHLILAASYAPNVWKGRPIKRGQLLTSRARLSRQTGLSEQEIRTCFSRLKSTNEITIESTKSKTLVTVCKYDVYQSNSEPINQEINQVSNQQSTNALHYRVQQDKKENIGKCCAFPPKLPAEDSDIEPAKKVAKKTPKKQTKPRRICPFDLIFTAYKAYCPNLRGVEVRDKTRMTAAKVLWGRLDGYGNPKRAGEHLTIYFKACQRSPFLRGEKPSQRHSNWKADFAFVCRDEQITKILEGYYDPPKEY